LRVTTASSAIPVEHVRTIIKQINRNAELSCQKSSAVNIVTACSDCKTDSRTSEMVQTLSLSF
jgi:hypothetical protein